MNYALVVLVDNDVEHVIIIGEDLKQRLPELRKEIKRLADQSAWMVPRLQAVPVDLEVLSGQTLETLVQAITEHWD